MDVIGIIPARMASTRFPGKPLVMIGQKSMIVRVASQALKSKKLDRVLVATDDEKIAEHVRSAGIETMLTSSKHATGTDRLGEVSERIRADIYVNIQGDEPFIEPGLIDAVVSGLNENPQWDVVTTASRFMTLEDWLNPNRVKVLCSDLMDALYFSRQPVPYTKAKQIPPNVYCHQGLYAYREKALNTFKMLSPHPVEIEESLEQLRLLMTGFRYGVILSGHEFLSVDVPEDLDRIKQWMNKKHIQ
jgi:3-deoxy-manno-octulosonate cytidylyltransferase (CMP-KDO synthetase)